MKQERVAQLNLLLHSHPEGLRRAEIARKLGVHRSTVSRYVDRLKLYIDIYEEQNLIKIRSPIPDKTVALSMYEMLAFNLSAESLLNTAELQNPHLASGLRKIALNMRSYAPRIAQNIVTLAESIDKEVHKKKEATGQFTAVLEVLIDCWVAGKMVKLEHQKENVLSETELAPYFIGFREEETGRNPISVTGRLRHSSTITTIDIASITKATLLDETYTIPDNLKPFQKTPTASTFESIDTISLVLLVKEKSALNSFDTINHSPCLFAKDKQGNTICRMEAENSIELLLRLVQCGDAITILQPESFRTKYLRWLKQIVKLYE